MSFTYDNNGIRTSKTVNGVTHKYYLNGSSIAAEEWGDKLLVYLYDACGYKQYSMGWAITENILGPVVIPFYFMFGY